ncbi:hypothetical protein X759_09350 [Mesorhizobium sp. LSHC420B00]|nr:hypothetical protein X759_09350 [Mesorhizobium sp. LSHC420B00]
MTQAGARVGDQPHLVIFLIRHASIAKIFLLVGGLIVAHLARSAPRPSIAWFSNDERP